MHIGQEQFIDPKIVGDMHNTEDGLENFRVYNFIRSEEHTSELQSQAYLVCRLLLEKKKKQNTNKKNKKKKRTEEHTPDPHTATTQTIRTRESSIYSAYMTTALA
mgnify:CR=1 FL=1